MGEINLERFLQNRILGRKVPFCSGHWSHCWVNVTQSGAGLQVRHMIPAARRTRGSDVGASSFCNVLKESTPARTPSSPPFPLHDFTETWTEGTMTLISLRRKH